MRSAPRRTNAPCAASVSRMASRAMARCSGQSVLAWSLLDRLAAQLGLAAQLRLAAQVVRRVGLCSAPNAAPRREARLKGQSRRRRCLPRRCRRHHRRRRRRLHSFRTRRCLHCLRGLAVGKAERLQHMLQSVTKVKKPPSTVSSATGSFFCPEVREVIKDTKLPRHGVGEWRAIRRRH